MVQTDFDEIRRLFEQHLDGFKSRYGDLEAQELRAAKTFALAATAGELATQWGLTGWPTDAALEACDAMFFRWRSYRGHGDLEPMRVRDAVARFVESNGDRYFTHYLDETRLNTERAGYWRDDPEGRVWLFTKAGLTKALQGIDFKRGVALLEACDWLRPGSDRKTVKVKPRANEAGSWFYAIRIGDGDHTD